MPHRQRRRCQYVMTYYLRMHPKVLLGLKQAIKDAKIISIQRVSQSYKSFLRNVENLTPRYRIPTTESATEGDCFAVRFCAHTHQLTFIVHVKAPQTATAKGNILPFTNVKAYRSSVIAKASVVNVIVYSAIITPIHSSMAWHNCEIRHMGRIRTRPVPI